MKRKEIVSTFVAIAAIGVLTGLIIEIMYEGDDAKLRSFLQDIKSNSEILFFPIKTAQLAEVDSMISSATIEIEVFPTQVDPDNSPNSGDEYFINQISECVFSSPEDIPFPTCLLCMLTDMPMDPGTCECTKPTIFSVRYNNPDNPNTPVRIEVYKKTGDFGDSGKILAEFDGVLDNDIITIDSRNFINDQKDTLHSNTAYRIIENGNEIAAVSIHTSCSKPLFIDDIFTDDNSVDDITMTVVSGTDEELNPTIPGNMCREITCECTKPTIFTVRYNNPVDPNTPVRIEVYKKIGDFGESGKLLAEFDGILDDDIVTIDSRNFINKQKDKVHSNTAYRIIQNGNEIAVSIHTSCSQLLFIDQVFSSGDVFLTVVSGFDKQGRNSLPDNTCELTQGTSVVVEGWKILPDGYQANTLESILIPVGIENSQNDVINIKRVVLGVCDQTPEDCECSKPTIFTVRYNNLDNPNTPVRIEVYKRTSDFGESGKLLAEFDNILDNDLVTIDSRNFINNQKDTVHSNTAYRVIRDGYDVAAVSIHTSCSKPLFIDDIFTGSNDVDEVTMTVVSGTDINGNPTIPLQICKIEEDLECKGLTSMTVAYSGPAVWMEISDKKIVNVIIEDTSNPALGNPPIITIVSNSGDKLPGDTKFKIYEINSNGDDSNGNRGSFITEIKIHTSCSKPISIGDVHTAKDFQGTLTITDLDRIS